MGLAGVGMEAHGTIPHLLFALYQGTFAIIAAALISGAVVERMRFGPYLAFLALWTVLVYAPVCHWVWGGGWLAGLGALDFAGGTVVHVNAGVAALVAALVLGRRRDHGRQALLPHNIPFVLLGAGLLWFGWIGFNAGSALAANGTAALALANTILAPAATVVVWMLLEARHAGKPTAVGVATGAVVGLVAVTPAAGFVGPMAALALGAVAAIPSYFAIVRRSRSRLDDSLDVAAAHGVGGLVGALLTGVLARAVWGGADGLLAGNPGQLLEPGDRGRCVAGVQRRRVLGDSQGAGAVRAAAGRRAPRRNRPRRDAPRRGGVRHRRRCDPGSAEAGGVRAPARERFRRAGDRAGPARWEGGLTMKMVTAIIRPDKLNDVLAALFEADVRGLTISRAQGHGGELEQVETYRGTTVKMELVEKVRLEIGVSDPYVRPTVEAILGAARTGEVGDGKVFVLPVEKVYRIRTGEEDVAAVTPAEPEAVPV